MEIKKTTSEIVNCFNCAFGRTELMRSCYAVCKKNGMPIEDNTACDYWKHCER